MALLALSRGGAAMSATLLALGAIALWATLASLGVALAHVPPFLLTGLALVIGSVPAWPLARHWRVPASTLALGVYGLFGFHFLLFVALRNAPPVEANLVNYLWPLLIVVLAPLFLPGMKLRPVHVGAALAGFVGAALAILGGRGLTGGFAWGYLPALGSAFIWASYSLLTRRVAHFPTAVGRPVRAGVGRARAALPPRASSRGSTLSLRDWGLIVAVGLGPLGAAFFLWDAALKRGDARRIGILSYLTPLASTCCCAHQRSLTVWIAVAALPSSALLGMRAR